MRGWAFLTPAGRCPLPRTLSRRLHLQGVGGAGLRLSSPHLPRPLPAAWARISLWAFPSNTEEVKDKGKNSWDLIACATSDKLESPKEAAIDLYLCLYVTWVLSLCNFPGTSSGKFNKGRNTGVCSLGP